MTNSQTPKSGTPAGPRSVVTATRKSRMPATAAAPAIAESQEPAPRKSGLGGPVVVRRAMVWQNISLIAASILLWAAWRFLFIRVPLESGLEWKFKKYDVMLIVLPPCLAFCLNWYWLREQRTDVITKWSLTWAVIGLVIYILGVIFGAHPLHMWMVQLSTAGS